MRYVMNVGENNGPFTTLVEIYIFDKNTFSYIPVAPV